MTSIPTGKCPMCGYRKRVNQNGKIYHHSVGDLVGVTPVACVGGGDDPVEGSVRVAAAEVVPVAAAEVSYVAGWYDRLYWPLIITSFVLAGAAVGFAVGVGVEGGWRW